jgi:hypothetical protein
VASADVKKEIDALSKDALRQEINFGETASRFKGEEYAYLKTRLSALEESEQRKEKDEEKARAGWDLQLRRVSTWVTVGTSILTLILGGGWLQESQKNQRLRVERNDRLRTEYLEQIGSLVDANKTIFSDLRSSPQFVEPGWGILEAYLAKIRRDGALKHSEMAERINDLVGNNEKIIALLDSYYGHIQTPEFRTQTAAFRDHALRYRDRWRALSKFAVAMKNCKGDRGESDECKFEFDTAVPTFPEQFPKALESEIALRKDPSKIPD